MVVGKGEGLKDLSYIFVELLPKDCVDSSITSAQAEKEVIGGLFAGIGHQGTLFAQRSANIGAH